MATGVRSLSQASQHGVSRRGSKTAGLGRIGGERGAVGHERGRERETLMSDEYLKIGWWVECLLNCLQIWEQGPAGDGWRRRDRLRLRYYSPRNGGHA